MSFRRQGKLAASWRKRLDEHEDLLQQAGLPDFVFRDEFTWMRFLEHAYHHGEAGVDVMALISDKQQEALHELLSCVYSDKERIGMSLWTILEARFGRQEK